jgi:flagellar protein FliT
VASEAVVAAYADVLALTERMLESARANDWDGLVRLEQERDRQVALLRQQDADPGRDPRLRARKRELIETILARDAEIRALTEDWMHELREILESAGNVQRLNKTYEQG